jgi:diaminopimelate epimerase
MDTVREIPFVKYTCYGNNFVIVDQAIENTLSESEMSAFARAATDTAFGIGSDNLLVVQRCEEEVLREISRERGYWPRLPDYHRADFVFRMFEPNGEEALCCGNGLACIADYLGQQHKQANVKILTEVPLQRPSILRIGSIKDGHTSWVDLGEPRRTPSELVTPGSTIPYTDSIELIEELTIQLGTHELEPYSSETSIALSGYLVFTGEPHLVVYPDEIFSSAALADCLYEIKAGSGDDADPAGEGGRFGSKLIHRIGSYVNTERRDMFPAGVSVNFVRLHADDSVEYRCFERGIDRETLACGTGALASAYVSHHLRGIDQPTIEVVPHRCRWYDPEACIRVRGEGAVWMLESSPMKLYAGSYVALERVFRSIGYGGVSTQLPGFDTPAKVEQQQNSLLAAGTA